MDEGPRFPPELISRIIKFAATHDDRAEILRSLLFTCSSVNREAEALLYEEVDIPGWLGNDPWHKTYWRRYYRILTNIGNNVRIAGHVKTLFIEIPCGSKLDEQPLYAPLLIQAFLKMINLKTLNVEGNGWPFRVLGQALYLAAFQLDSLSVDEPLTPDSEVEHNPEDFITLLRYFLARQKSLCTLRLGSWPGNVDWGDDISAHLKSFPRTIVPNLSKVEGPPHLANVFLHGRPGLKQLVLDCANLDTTWPYLDHITKHLSQVEKLDLWSSHNAIPLAKIAGHCTGLRYLRAPVIKQECDALKKMCRLEHLQVLKITGHPLPEQIQSCSAEEQILIVQDLFGNLELLHTVDVEIDYKHVVRYVRGQVQTPQHIERDLREIWENAYA